MSLLLPFEIFAIYRAALQLGARKPNMASCQVRLPGSA
jgi:hypothetical protein